MRESINPLIKIINNERFILILFALYVMTTNLDYSVFNVDSIYITISRIIRYGIYIIAIIKIIFESIKNKKVNLVAICIILLSIIIVFTSRDKSLLTILMIILLIRNIKFETITQCCFFSNLLIYLILILGSAFEIVPNWIYPRGQETRYSYGYCYPTLASTYLFLLLLMRFYLKKGNIEFWEIALELLTVAFVFIATDSRMGLTLSLIIITAEIVIRIREIRRAKERIYKIKGILKYCLIALPIIVITITGLLVIEYSKKSDIGIKTNKIMSDRLKYTKQAIEKYGITPFGKEIKWQGWGGYGHVEIDEFNYNFVDIAYFKILFDKGTIFLIIYIWGYTLYMRKIVNENNLLLIFINSIILLWGMIEPNILELGKNPFIILMVIELFDTGKNINISNNEKGNREDNEKISN